MDWEVHWLQKSDFLEGVLLWFFRWHLLLHFGDSFAKHTNERILIFSILSLHSFSNLRRIGIDHSKKGDNQFLDGCLQALVYLDSLANPDSNII